jgi:Carboxypeptidase regulatory-like domain
MQIEWGKSPRGRASGCPGHTSWRWLAPIAIALMAPLAAMAQLAGTGTIEGTVTDPSGAVIAGATISAQNVATGVVITRTTSKSGLYSLSPLDVGAYTVTVTASGFEKLMRENLHVDGMQVLALNLTLQVGATTMTVTVDTAPPALETDDATLGAAMENDVYQSLPLEMGAYGQADQRRVTDFASLMPGVSANETSNNATDEPMVVNGNATATEMYIEGIPFTAAGGQGDPRAIWPAFGVETIDQFQLKTTGYSAEYQGLGVENFSVKSGSNQIHGTVYDIVRNTAFNSWGFIPATDVATGKIYKPPVHMNEYGINAGGPLWKDKIFMFAAFSGYRYSTITNPVYNTIPTADEMSGDFSATGVNIYDPTTETCASGSSCTRTQFSYGGKNNVIPPGEISPIAQNMQQFWNGITYANSNLTNNYLGSYAYGLSNWSGSARVDAHINSKQTVTLLLATGRQGLVGPSSQSTNVGPFPYRDSKIYRPITHVGIFEHTYLITSNLVNQFKYGASQYHSPDFNPTQGISAWEASTLGVKGLPSGQAAGSFPEESFSGTDAPSQWGTQNGYQGNTDSLNLLDNLQWVHGKHSLSFGGQYQWLEYNYIYAFEGTTPATLKYAVNETGQLNNKTSVTSGTGLPYASFLLGAVDSGSYTQYAPQAQETGARFHPFALYVNDDYKLSSKLTLNIGLRWDVMPPFREAENRWAFLNPTATNPITGSPGALEFAGSGSDSCSCTTPVNTYYKNLGPRVGLAYSLDSKTVIRASYGVYYTHGGGVGGSANSQPTTTLELGFSAAPNPSSPGDALPAFYLNGNPAFTGAATVNGYTNDPTSVTFGGTGYSAVAPPIFDARYGTYYSSAAASPYKLSTTLGYIDPYYSGRAPQFSGWSFGFQRELAKHLTATVSYVGNEGHFLYASGARGVYSNEISPSYLSLGNTLGATATAANMPSGSLPYATFNNTVGQALKPFPQYNGVSDIFGSVSNSNYNALQVSVVQQLSHGLTFMVNYTWSKTIDDAGTFRSGYAIPAGFVANNPTKSYALDRIDRSLSTIDVPQNISATSTYDLPFGKGQIGDGSAIVRSLAGGWRLSTIFTAITGNPLVITSSSCAGIVGQGTCMPAINPNFSGSIMPNGKWGHRATAANLGQMQYVNPNAFLQTGQLANEYVLGDARRTAPFGLRGPSNYDIDGSLRRTFDIWREGRVKFVFEANVFNAVNHVWFGSTSGDATASIGESVTGATTVSGQTVQNNVPFGTASGQANLPRQWQFAGHINF